MPTAHTSLVAKAVRPPIAFAVPGLGVMTVVTAAGAAGAATASSTAESGTAAVRAWRGIEHMARSPGRVGFGGGCDLIIRRRRTSSCCGAATLSAAGAEPVCAARGGALRTD